MPRVGRLRLAPGQPIEEFVAGLLDKGCTLREFALFRVSLGLLDQIDSLFQLGLQLHVGKYFFLLLSRRRRRRGRDLELLVDLRLGCLQLLGSLFKEDTCSEHRCTLGFRRFTPC